MPTSDTVATPEDIEAVAGLLGRRPQGQFDVVVRDPAGAPVVIRNAPLLDDDTPMPTRYWLVGRRESELVGRLESHGGVNVAEAELGLELIAEAHERYREERDHAFVELGANRVATAHRPSGGVGGTRVGVKCLHAHYAWFLAGGDDPVGRWVHQQITAQS